MKKIPIFTALFVCGVLLTAAVMGGWFKPSRVNDSYSKILVSSKVVEALGKIGDPRAREVLVSALKSKESLVRAYAAKALGRIENKESITSLKELTDDRSYLVRILATAALINLEEEQATEVLVAFLEDDNPAVRAAAAEEAGGLGEYFLSKLNAMLLKEKDEFVLVELIGQLGKNKFNPAVSSIRRLLENQSAMVRAAVCRTIGELDDKESIPWLLERLNDTNIVVRAEAKIALGRLGDRSQIEVFWKESEEKNPLLAASSYTALAYLREWRILPVLLKEIIVQENPLVKRKAAACALTILRPEILNLIKDDLAEGEILFGIPLLKNLQIDYQAAGRNLILIYTEALKDNSNPLYQDAPLILESFKDRIALPALRESLLQDDPDLTAAAAYVLGELRDKDAIACLVDLFNKYGG